MASSSSTSIPRKFQEFSNSVWIRINAFLLWIFPGFDVVYKLNKKAFKTLVAHPHASREPGIRSLHYEIVLLPLDGLVLVIPGPRTTVPYGTLERRSVAAHPHEDKAVKT